MRIPLSRLEASPRFRDLRALLQSRMALYLAISAILEEGVYTTNHWIQIDKGRTLGEKARDTQVHLSHVSLAKVFARR